jgi:GTPase
VAEGAPLIEVWNKVDLLEGDARDAVLTQAARTEDLFAVSAITGEGMDRLLAAIPDKLKDPRSEEKLALTFAEGRKRAWLFEQGIVTSDVQTETGYDVTVFWTVLQKERFARL